MFLAELAYNTVAREITSLEKKKEERQNTLQTSQAELESDHMELIRFINEDTQHKNSREEEEKR